MRLFIFSSQPEITRIMYDHFSAKGFLCVAFYKTEDFLVTLERLSIPPDLIILDYMLFNHEIFNIYQFLKDRNCHAPCIYYNDPCLTRHRRKLHWQAQIDLLQNEKGNVNFEPLLPVFDDLEKLIENKSLKKSIYLMQEPEPFGKQFIVPQITLDYLLDAGDQSIESFMQRNSLSSSLYCLLKILYDYRSVKLSLQDIKKIYDKKDKHISESSLYVMLSRLRSIVRSDKQGRFIIRKDGEYYHFVEFTSKDN